MVPFKLLHPRATQEMLGAIPFWLDEANPATAKDQLNAAYHFGGWIEVPGFTLNDDDSLSYPGDPDLKPIAEAMVHEEKVYMYQYSIIAVVRQNRTFNVTRMD